MNTTKLLCKYFDEDEKGYVTIGDILKYSPLITLTLFGIGYYIYGVYEWLFTDYVIVGPISLIGFFNDFAFMWGIFLTVVACIIVCVLILIWIYILIEDIKIVSCKKDDKPDSDK